MILALIFIVSIGLIVGALSDWAMNDINNSTKFKSASELDYTASSTVEVAIQSIQHYPVYTETASPNIGYCWAPTSGYVSQQSLNGYKVAVWCTTVQVLKSQETRTVTFYACRSTLKSNSSSATVQAAGVACGAHPLLLAQVVYDDYAPGQPPLTQTCTTSCGESATPVEWQWAG